MFLERGYEMLLKKIREAKKVLLLLKPGKLGLLPHFSSEG
jgi:hypothetical protein